MRRRNLFQILKASPTAVSCLPVAAGDRGCLSLRKKPRCFVFFLHRASTRWKAVLLDCFLFIRGHLFQRGKRPAVHWICKALSIILSAALRLFRTLKTISRTICGYLRRCVSHLSYLIGRPRWELCPSVRPSIPPSGALTRSMYHLALGCQAFPISHCCPGRLMAVLISHLEAANSRTCGQTFLGALSLCSDMFVKHSRWCSSSSGFLRGERETHKQQWTVMTHLQYDVTLS